MDSVLAFALIFIVYAIGDAIATKSKGVFSMMLFAFIFYLIGFWTFLPDTFFNDSGITAVSYALVCILMVHIGTTIKISDFKRLWKTVVIALVICAAIAFGIVFVAPLFVEKGYAIVGGPIVSGAIVAALIMQEAAAAIGRNDLVVFATVILVLQNFVGIPIASLCLKSEAKRYKAIMKTNGVKLADNSKVENIKKSTIIPQLPSKYLSDNVIIAKLAIVSVASIWLSNLTNGTINALVIALVLGVVFKELGFLEDNAVGKANGSVFVMAAAPIAAFTGLVSATPQMLMDQIVPLVVVFLVGLLFMLLSAIVMGKIFKMSWQMSTALGASALFGFPTTYILANEVSESVGETTEEKEMLRQHLQPNMVIAGVVTVSISSVIFAGIIANML